MAGEDQPTLRNGNHHSTKYAPDLMDKTNQLQQKAQKAMGKDPEKSGPAGGFDSTKLEQRPAGYTIRITFHRAENLPFADIPSFSSDPYILATLRTDLPKRHKQDPDLSLRTPTIHRNVNPKWETQWIIAHIPASGFSLKCRLYDEDPADHDDRLGNVDVTQSNINENWQGYKEQSFSIKKRMGSKRAYTFRGCAALFSRNIKMSGDLILSVENLGRSPGDGSRAYTIAPLPWSKHHSPLIGRIAGTKDDETVGKDGKQSQRYNFQAVQMQLRGPIPEALYHRYVEFKPFVAGMFTDHSLRGRILNRALHHQHARVYNFDGSTVYGVFESPSERMTRQFLEFVHFDQGGRIFTYVITLDGQWRFTETGKEFGIDMLSKHTMHSDVSIYIAFSGEFFIRRLKHPHSHKNEPPADHEPLPPTAEPSEDGPQPTGSSKKNGASGAGGNNCSEITAEASQSSSSTPSSKSFPKNASYYELIIDNDSGTYRPNADLLPQLKAFLETNLPGLHIVTLDCNKDEEKMNKLKTEQREKKKSGKQITYMQNASDTSLSSSDEEELNARAEGREPLHGYERKVKEFKDGKKNYEGFKADRHGPHQGREDSNQTQATSSNTNEQQTGGDVANGQVEPNEKHEKEKIQAVEETYNNQEAANLVARSEQQASRTRTVTSDEYGEPEKGDNKPSGGIVYDKVVRS